MNKKTKKISLFILLVIILFINFYPLPYYVTRPGMAQVLDEIIDVQGGYDEKGEFMLTTVRMGEANVISYVMAKMKKYYSLEPKNAILLENETDEEYQVRQSYYMENSQENALQVAFQKAGKEVNVTMNGIYVLSVQEGMPADEILKPGDRIVAIDQQNFDSSTGFTNYIQGKQIGDDISVTFFRNGEKLTRTVAIAELSETKKPGIGIVLVEDKDVKTNPEVKINTEQIGGPSAGLMFSLEIYNQLVKEDITKGYRIAGTGMISSDGTVGPIGGIEQKIVAADREGAEIFFAPNENGAKNSNYEMAKKTAKDIDTKMKIVPVDTIDDALAYLEKLEAKK
ncbi:SepM family pheromone-processing serine protease [Caldifermentibacillus hisashii]|uniref:SepM family pheromone-processing serine protease n=1 Tax=Caldifermentibacillus hisashii TaxID=996558 RepID=UPI0030EAE011